MASNKRPNTYGVLEFWVYMTGPLWIGAVLAFFVALTEWLG